MWGFSYLPKVCIYFIISAQVSLAMIGNLGMTLLKSDFVRFVFPLSSFASYTRVMLCCLMHPLLILFGQTKGSVYEDVDLSEGDWAEYDEDEAMPVSVCNLKARFVRINHKLRVFPALFL